MLIGVVGKANTGKSTFFKAATLMDIEIANYPFATIKPNHGVGFIKIKDAARDFGKTANPREGFVQDKFRFVPIDMIDVAGLVPGAHEGKGMGSQFLDDLRQADALIHVIDVSGSTNEKGEPIDAGSYDPANDVKFLEEELDYWYLAILKKGWEKFARQVQQEHSELHKALAKQLSGLGVDENMIKQGIKELNLNPEQPIKWEEKDLFKLSAYLRKITKPMIIAANKIDIPGAIDNYNKLKDQFPNHIIIPCSAESELALKEASKHELINYIPGEKDFTITEEGETKLNDKQKTALNFIKDNILRVYAEGTGVQSILNNVVLDILKYIAIHPGGVNKLEDQNGNVLPDCFLMKEKSTAIDFAFKLHTDFGKNFIRCIDVRTKRTHGRDYPLKHLDIIEIAANK
jgi:ribosome-binding ATPase YchF (GTP1/OBG family)